MKFTIFFASIFILATTACSGDESNFDDDYTQQATSLLKTQGYYESLQKQTDLEKAKFLNAFVYSYCRNELPHNPVEKLFEDCNTACGGRAFLLKSLLHAVDVNSRKLNIYNVPVQGNHVMVEILNNGKAHLFDPTFGVYFKNPTTAEPLSYEEIWNNYRFQDITHLVFQTIYQIPAPEKIASPDTIYDNTYFAPSMPIEGYTWAEAYSLVGIDAWVTLSAKLKLGTHLTGLYVNNYVSPQAVDSDFLQYTNDLLNAGDHEHFLSFVFMNLGYSSFNVRQRLVLTGSELLEDHTYSLTLMGYNSGEPTDLKLTFDSSKMELNARSIQVPSGQFQRTILITFPSALNSGTIPIAPEIFVEAPKGEKIVKIFDYLLSF